MRWFSLIVCLLAALPGAGELAARTVTDLAGRRVEIPDTVRRVACLEVLCYPRMLMLGAEDRVVTMVRTAAPWMTRTNPRVGEIPSFQGTPGRESILATGADIAFVNVSYGATLPALAEIGLPALVSQPVGRRPQTAEAFIAEAKAMVSLFGQVLGGEAEPRARAWCAYVDERVRFVRDRVAAVLPEQRPKLYYVRGPTSLNTQGKGGYVTWVGEIAGARMVVNQSNIAGKGDTSMEDIVLWNPDIVIVGRQYPLELVRDDPRWKDIAAVRAGRVHSTPEGAFYWDGGPEQILLLQFLAKLLYPDLFADFDMAAEVRAYYARFYRIVLSDDEAIRLLNGQSPDGSRFNPMNN
ncbi:ABC transporter substrate-binding protein [Magnetospirillum fulvum]|uniref:Iron complex transport system substrate-binding protein n=1 Tax=Magnetospirillum fulvum TaxID=1082 RepID=A0A1H6IVR6_MAGFU|nr:ABC transporter substrate-binding protein [Magnetospirillum fulvum]SEH51187.1 iron complex transport system substrate-binding protein [Magnetospirillum fulvum]